MDRDHVHCIQNAIVPQQADEIRVDRRNPAQRDLYLGIHLPDGLRCSQRHFGKHLPVRINVKIPVGKVVGFIPQHYRFNH